MSGRPIILNSVCKFFSLIKMTKWHAHVVDVAKHMNMVGGPGPRPLGSPLNPALG